MALVRPSSRSMGLPLAGWGSTQPVAANAAAAAAYAKLNPGASNPFSTGMPGVSAISALFTRTITTGPTTLAPPPAPAPTSSSGGGWQAPNAPARAPAPGWGNSPTVSAPPPAPAASVDPTVDPNAAAAAAAAAAAVPTTTISPWLIGGGLLAAVLGVHFLMHRNES
jgi:hypothetical protein